MTGTFGRAKRTGLFDRSKEATPSSWKYNPRPTYKINEQNKGYTIKGKEAKFYGLTAEGNPGPGAYNEYNKYVLLLKIS